MDISCHADSSDDASRLSLVRAAKRRKAALGLPTDLTPDELDALLPPVSCRRTRVRLDARASGAPPRRRPWGATALRGVYPTASGRYQGRLRLGGRLFDCGTHATPGDAARAVEALAARLAGVV